MHADVVGQLLWKKIDVAFNDERFAVAEQWCRLAQHRIFEKAGETNVTKIERLYLCHF